MEYHTKMATSLIVIISNN